MGGTGPRQNPLGARRRRLLARLSLTADPAASSASSQPGVFAAGDVRRASIKRVASAAGEGAVVISQVHAYLNDVRQAGT